MMKGLIPAAGEGVRAYPATRFQPKVLLAIAGKPVIVRNIEITDGRIAAVVEKPAAPANNLLGVGTYLLQPRIADWIRKTPPSPRSGRVEFTDALMRAIEGGERVVPVPLAGQYFNINTIEDYNDANYAARDRNFERYR